MGNGKWEMIENKFQGDENKVQVRIVNLGLTSRELQERRETPRNDFHKWKGIYLLSV